MTEQNNRPPRVDGGTNQSHSAQQPLLATRRVEGIVPGPLEVAERALEGTQPSTDSWFTRTNINPTPNLTPERAQPLYTPYTPAPEPSQIPGAQGLPQGLPQRTTGPSHASQGAPRPDARFFQPDRPAPPAPPHPVPAHAQLPQHAYRPNPYTPQQPRIHPARPPMYANPAMPPYAAAQVPTRHGSLLDHRRAPGARTVNKKAVLMPLAAMAIASAAIGAFAQANHGTGAGTGFEAQTQQVKAHANQYDAIPATDRLGDQEVVEAPGVIAPQDAAPAGPASPAVERATAGGRHSNGNYDGPSLAWTYGGAHTLSGSIPAPSAEGSSDPDQDPSQDPGHDPAPSPEPSPEPQPTPESEPERPTIGKNVIVPTLDTATSVVGTLTGIRLDLTR